MGARLARSYLSVAPSVCRISWAITTLLARVIERSAKAFTTPTSPFCRPTECGTELLKEGSWYITKMRICGGACPGGCEFRRAYRRTFSVHHMVEKMFPPASCGGGFSCTSG